MRDFRDAKVLITGAASGIGRSLAQQFLERGARVLAVDIEEQALVDMAAEFAVVPFLADVSLESDVERLKIFAAEQFGAIDVLCNGAGVGVAGLTWETPTAVWDWTYEVNVKSIVNTIAAFVPAMIENNRGNVMNVASVAGMLATPGMAAYSASKHAVVGLTETLFHDLALRKVDVDVAAVCAGMVDTNISNSARNWPARFGVSPMVDESRTSQAIRKRHQRALSKSQSADAVAKTIVDAMAQGQFWIFTDDDYRDDIVQRSDLATAAQQPKPSPYV